MNVTLAHANPLIKEETSNQNSKISIVKRPKSDLEASYSLAEKRTDNIMQERAKMKRPAAYHSKIEFEEEFQKFESQSSSTAQCLRESSGSGFNAAMLKLTEQVC